jgi:Fe-S-cluster containining protein
LDRSLKKAYAEYSNILLILDAAIKTRIKRADISCKESCGYCCSQLIIMRRIETSYMLYAIQDCSDLIKKTIMEQLREWKNRYISFININRLASFEKLIEEENRLKYFQLDNKCPFLNRENSCCYIYNARPIACRLHYVSTPIDRCKSYNKTERELRLDTRDFYDFLSPMLNDLEKQFSLLYNTGKRIYDTFHTNRWIYLSHFNI